MATRRYDFVVGISTSDAPTAGDPTASGDIMTLGYADKSYARRRDLGWTVESYAALTAIGTTGDNQRYDGQVRLVEGTGELWRFDAESVATPDGATILAPDSGTGRWLIVSGGSTSAGGGVSYEALAQKLELEKYGLNVTEMLDNSVGYSGRAPLAQSYYVARLIADAASGAVEAPIVWSPITLSTTDANTDTTTGWTAVNAGASLTTSVTAKAGTASLQFDKNNSATNASIRYDRGSQNLSLFKNSRLWFYINLPSITNLSSVHVRVYADTTSNFRSWAVTTNSDGGALTTGWNLIFVDLSDPDSLSTTGGTGWSSSQNLSRYVELGVNTSSSGQTYTAILIDSIYFGDKDVRLLSVPGNEYTLHNNSTRQAVQFDYTNVSGDGMLDLVSPLTASYAGGASSGATISFIKRSTLTTASGYFGGFDTGLGSGTIVNTQELRISRKIRDDINGTFSAFVDLVTPQDYRVRSTTATTILVDDTGATSGNCVSGDTFHLFRSIPTEGEEYYTYVRDVQITANSSAVSGVITLTTSTAGASGVIQNDRLVKSHLTTSMSVVSLNDNESFASLTPDSPPDGIQLQESGIFYPDPGSVAFHYLLGAPVQSEAIRNQFGTRGRNTLDAQGSLTFSQPGPGYNRLSVSGFTTSNFLQFPTTAESTITEGIDQNFGWFSIWVNYQGTVGAERAILSNFASSTFNRGWNCRIPNGTNNASLVFFENTGGVTITLTNAFRVGWNHVAFTNRLNSNTIQQLWVNGVKATANVNTSNSGDSNKRFAVGVTNTGVSVLEPATNLMFSDLAYFYQVVPTDAQVLSIYNGGNYRPLGVGGRFARYFYNQVGQSGQKISLKAELQRTNNVVNPFVYKAGLIKT